MTASDAYLDKTCKKSCGLCGADFYRDKRCTWKHWGKAKFCSRVCSCRWGHENRKPLPPIKEHFLSRVSMTDGCWSFNGPRDKDGYGKFSYGRGLYRANRLSLFLHKGDAPSPEMYACHTCDNPGCVNPDHLYWGSSKQNSMDKINRGRHVMGEGVHCAKLCDEVIPNIRMDSRPAPEIASDYGVSTSSILQVKSKHTWKHIP